MLLAVQKENNVSARMKILLPGSPAARSLRHTSSKEHRRIPDSDITRADAQRSSYF